MRHIKVQHRKQKMKKFTLVQVSLVGIQFYEAYSDLENLEIHQPLELVQEPENEWDANAIKVLMDGKQLGHISKMDNVLINSWINQDMDISAEIDLINMKEVDYRKVQIAVILTV